MSTPNSYFIDPNSPAEMARLIMQDHLFNQEMGIFPEPIAAKSRVADIGCGPGGWLLDVANTYLEQGVTGLGVDIDREMIEYAQSQQAAADLENLTFEEMDMRQLPWSLPDKTFDIVNARLIGFLSPSEWPAVIREMWRITRPGGLVRLTETELNFSNSKALNQVQARFCEALWRAGQSFSPDGRRLDITPMLASLLRQGGFRQVKVRSYGIDWSFGAEAHGELCKDALAAFKLSEPFIVRMTGVPQEVVEKDYDQMKLEIGQPGFSGIFYLLSAWGRKQEE